jgi:hypothetical protein
MRNVGSIMVLLAVAAVGCESPRRALLLGPTPLASTPPPIPPPPQPIPHPRLGDATPIAIGETVKSQTTADDPWCAPGGPHRCRYFKVTAPIQGVLRVTMRWSAAQPDPYPLDIGVHGPTGEWLPVVGPGAQRHVDVRADAGATYLIEVWSFLTPAERFELTSSLESR